MWLPVNIVDNIMNYIEVFEDIKKIPDEYKQIRSRHQMLRSYLIIHKRNLDLYIYLVRIKIKEMQNISKSQKEDFYSYYKKMIYIEYIIDNWMYIDEIPNKVKWFLNKHKRKNWK